MSRKRVIRPKREDGLRARKRYNVTTMSDHDQPIAGNLQAQQFAREAPNQQRVATRPSSSLGSAACSQRWTPSFGQVFVTAKVESGFMIQAALG